MSASQAVFCSVCGEHQYAFNKVLWKSLIDEWQLSPLEVDYIDRQQGQRCGSCGSNLRSIALSNAIRTFLETEALLCDIPKMNMYKDLKILEINEAGMLSPFLKLFPHYVYASYPEVDMHSLPYADGSFDLVIHSDTLEHVSNPIHALTECKRVLKSTGALCFTVPMVVGRLSKSREGLPPSYHGNPAVNATDYIVHTEYGADAWTHLLLAGFTEVTINSVQYPAALALTARNIT
jgi:SAM-dependent methyltransferase